MEPRVRKFAIGLASYHTVWSLYGIGRIINGGFKPGAVDTMVWSVMAGVLLFALAVFGLFLIFRNVD